MSDVKKFIEQSDDELLIKLLIDSFRRIIVHYGSWFAEVEHQLGMENALDVEQNVWDMSFSNQLNRIGKTLGFPVDKGVPEFIKSLPRQTLIDLIEKIGINWLANDGIWFQAVEKNTV